MKKYSNKDFYQAFGDMLREKNMKLRGLSARTNLDYTYFSKLKNRKKSPPIKTIEIIASGLGIDPDYFLEYRIDRITRFLKDNPGHVQTVLSYIRKLEKKDKLKVADPGQPYD